MVTTSSLDASPFADRATGDWRHAPLTYDYGRDRWHGSFVPIDSAVGRYTVEAWTDRFATWRHALATRLEAGRDVGSSICSKAPRCCREAAPHATATPARRSLAIAENLGLRRAPRRRARRACGRTRTSCDLVPAHLPPRDLTRHARELSVIVDRERARFAAWYEMFPRSHGAVPGRTGTFARRRRAPPGDRRPRLRRRVSAADSPDRLHASERREQTHRQPVPTIRAARGRSAAPQAATPPSIRRSGRSPTSITSSPPPPSTASRSRSTTRRIARPTIPGSASTRIGSCTGPTARSNAPRIRPTLSKTSYRWTSGAPIATALWSACRDVFAVLDRDTACERSASTTPTPSRSRSGNG